MLLVEVRSLSGLVGSRARLYSAVDADAVVVEVMRVLVEDSSLILCLAFRVVAVEEVERGGGGKGLKFEYDTFGTCCCPDCSCCCCACVCCCCCCSCECK